MSRKVHEAVAHLRSFFQSGQTQSIAFRAEQLSALKKMIIDHQAQLLEALQQDLAKAPFEAYISEIHLILQELDYTRSFLSSWTRPQRVPTPFTHFPSSSLIISEPYGIVLIIGAWNYPLQLLLIPLIGALAAGNCAILKPSEHAPHCSQLLTKIISDTFPADYVTVIEGDAAVGQALLYEKFDYIFFTGSTHVGKRVMQAAAQQLTPLTLELGGKNPCIVTQYANLDCAAKRIAWGKFYNAGQNCIAPDYILCEQSVKASFIKHLETWVIQFYGKDPQQSPHYSRIINTKHVDRLSSLLSDGDIIFGGTIDKNTKYIAPTIIDNIDANAPIMQEEIFGPLLPIVAYDSFDQVIHFINNRPHPLALYLFSSSSEEQNNILFRTQSGGVSINDVLMHAASPHLPFGGIGASGFGAYRGKKTFDTFTHYKAVIHNSCRFDFGLRYPPYGKKHRWLQKILEIFNR